MNNTIDLKEIAKIAAVVALGIFAFVGVEDFIRLFAQ